MKKITFFIVTLILFYGLIEFLSLMAFWAIKKQPFSFQKLILERQKVCETIEARPDSLENFPDFCNYEIIHPYLGFVCRPDQKNISQFGFSGNQSALFTKSKNQVVIGVFGGSVAEVFTETEKEFLKANFKKIPAFSGGEISFVNLALGGYKQPQQLLALNYFLVLGGHFDIIINIDGFNEVALPSVENLPKGTAPFYPRAWFFRISKLDQNYRHKKLKNLLENLSHLQNYRKTPSAIMLNPLFKYSVTLNLLWKIEDQRIFQKISRINLKLLDWEIKNKTDYQKTGPKYSCLNDKALYQDLASLWKRSSLEMNNICKANGIKYFHFLQPNQYVRGSKIMPPEEQKIALNKDQPYRIAVEKGYPYLIKEGQELKEMDVNFWDLTKIFINNREILYSDDACHFNKKGNDVMAQVIFEKIKPFLLSPN